MDKETALSPGLDITGWPVGAGSIGLLDGWVRDDGDPGPNSLQLLDVFVLKWRDRRLALPHGVERLISLLALISRPIRRAEAVKTLWPHQSEAQASGALRTTMWRINRLCPGSVVSDRPGWLSLSPELSVDVRTLVTRARLLLTAGPEVPLDVPALAALQSSANLLPGWYEDWVIQCREQLLALRITVLRVTAERLLGDGDPGRALDLALSAVVLEPLNEYNHRLITRIHLTQGNASEAMRQYALCAALFRAELGADPSQDFRTMVPRSSTVGQSWPRSGP
jgi:DNA-binding SARP family transcriptional activator